MTDMEQQQKEVRKKALKLLGHMDRTEKGLYDRLLRAGFSEALAADAVAYVKDYGYVNDARYATNYIMYRIHDKSRQKIFQELQQKGIDRQTIQSAWDEAAELEKYADILCEGPGGIAAWLTALAVSISADPAS